MRELAIVVAFSLCLAAIAAVGLLDPAAVMAWGQTIMLGSIGLALPFEALYFFGLSRRRLPAGWYWRSFEHHQQLSPGERWWVLGSFMMGSLFMLTSVLGILAVVAATVRVIQQI